MGWLRRIVVLCAALVALALAGRAAAAEFFDNQRGEFAARVSTQNTFQHDNTKSIDWVQWRNEVRLELRYDFLKLGSARTWGPINLFRLNMLYRGRMDPVYLVRGSFRDRGYDRGDFIFPEGKTPRELFVDIGFEGVLRKLSFRVGKQQVVWGEADLFRSIDVVNPLDLTQNGFLGEDFADFRRPLWIFKGLYDFGNLSRYLNSIGVEFFVSPNNRPQVSQQNVLFGETFKLTTLGHNVVTGFRRNLVLPFRQVRAPWEFGRVGTGYGDSPAVVQNADGTFTDFMYRIKNDVPPTEFSKDALMAGIRILGNTIGNTNFTLNYLFTRSDAASSAVEFAQFFDASQPGTGAVRPDVLNAAVSAALTPDLNGNGIPDGQEQQILNCLQSKPRGRGELILDPHSINPAFTGSFDGSVYSDPSNPALHTGAAKPGVNALPRNNVSYTPVLPVPGDGLVHNSACLDIPVFHPWTHIIGFTLNYNDEWTGLVYRVEQSYSTKEPRQLSPNSPERLLAQLHNPGDPTRLAVPQERDFATRAKRYTAVWRSMIGFDWFSSIASNYGRTVQNELIRSLLTDQWVVSFQFLNQYDSHADHVDHSSSFTDRYQTWNPFFTLSGSGFFLHQKFRPTWAFAFDPNQLFPVVYLQGSYFVTSDLEVKIGEILYTGSKNAEDAGGLHYYADRDTLFLRLTYYLA